MQGKKISIDSKYFAVKPKHNWTRAMMVQDLNEKGVQITEEELNDYIKNNFSSKNSRKILHNIVRNENAAKKSIPKQMQRGSN